eukprot:6826168-Alexandrium_andersonii.AAC.1
MTCATCHAQGLSHDSRSLTQAAARCTRCYHIDTVARSMLLPVKRTHLRRLIAQARLRQVVARTT